MKGRAFVPKKNFNAGRLMQVLIGPQVSEKSTFVGEKTKSKFLAAVRDPGEKPIRIARTRNVWIWRPGSIRPTLVVHLIKTAPQ